MSGAPTRPVRALGGERVGEAARVLAASFADDPVYARVFPDGARRERALRAFMTIPVRDGRAHGHVDGIEAGDGRLAGVAVWLPPGANPWSAGRRLRALPGLVRVALVAPRSMPALSRLGGNADQVFPAKDEPWYLEVVGVRPSEQGGGVGTRLLAAGLQRVDASREGCYLETPREANVRFYRRHGFEVEREGVELLPGGPTHWTMRRPPGGGA